MSRSAYPLLAASEGMEDEEALRLLKPTLTRLFKDARVECERYSILWEATIEFCRWHNYP